MATPHTTTMSRSVKAWARPLDAAALGDAGSRTARDAVPWSAKVASPAGAHVGTSGHFRQTMPSTFETTFGRR